MSQESALTLLQALSERILARYLEGLGEPGVTRVGRSKTASDSVDIMYGSGAKQKRVKVKSDAYFGLDASKIADRSLPLYRAVSDTCAFEVVSDVRTGEPGWALRSDADELFYYRVAIAEQEPAILALLEEPDDIFYPELKLERDELRVVPMRDFRKWFGKSYDRYPARPVVTTEYSAWYRLVPWTDVERAVKGIKTVSPVFQTLWP